jgi:hypothetical protein
VTKVIRAEKPLLDTARCLGCDYPLRGLPQHRCPECGRVFDPADATTFNPGLTLPLIVRWSLRPAGPLLCLWALVAAIALALYPSEHSFGEGAQGIFWELDRYRLKRGAIAVLLWVGLLLFWIARTSWRRWIVRRYRQRPELLRNDRRARRLTCWLFLVAYFISCILVYECPHATYFALSGLGGLARSAVGGPCYHHARWSAHLIGNWYVFLG